MTKYLSRFAKNEAGATSIEYALIGAIVGAGIIVALDLVGDGLNDIFTKAGAKLAAVST